MPRMQSEARLKLMTTDAASGTLLAAEERFDTDARHHLRGYQEPFHCRCTALIEGRQAPECVLRVTSVLL